MTSINHIYNNYNHKGAGGRLGESELSLASELRKAKQGMVLIARLYKPMGGGEHQNEGESLVETKVQNRDIFGQNIHIFPNCSSNIL